MDAHALLTSQGWRGVGHSLHPTSDNTGLARPLLVSRKQDSLGVGKKQHRTSDMWWMNAFDKSLKGLDTTKEGKVVQTVTIGGLDIAASGGSKYVENGGLYAFFVQGESLTGTITAEDYGQSARVNKPRKSKLTGETKEERRARKAAKRVARADCVSWKSLGSEALDNLNHESVDREESKEQRRERRKQRKYSA